MNKKLVAVAVAGVLAAPLAAHRQMMGLAPAGTASAARIRPVKSDENPGMCREPRPRARNVIFTVHYHDIRLTTVSPDSWPKWASWKLGRPFGDGFLLLWHNKDETP